MKSIWKLMSIVAIFTGLAACKKAPVSVQSISLDKSEVELGVGNSTVLVATVLPDNADDKTVVWSTADPSIVTVSNGTVTAVKVGETKITATSAGFTAECAVSVFYDAPAVDLGLSVKWASYNVGATKPEDAGHYFAWGETSGKENYGWAKEGDYKWGVYDSSASPKFGMTKYTAYVEGGDGLKTLQPGDDPATANWGTKWRTPTLDEINELLDNTKCEWTWDATKKGCTVKGLNTGNSIFLPAAGYRYGSDLDYAGRSGSYWSSSVHEFSPYRAYFFSFGSDYHGWGRDIRYFGDSVRAVTEY
ncbi:MAG: Ig-like domain-containing protein [Bacteroidales bacterium]|nr:Ig-like domain-containing protein [Candidatus Cryptobacteroides choladohippi]